MEDREFKINEFLSLRLEGLNPNNYALISFLNNPELSSCYNLTTIIKMWQLENI